ncbi:MAG: radical SAM protein, partial [Desulfobacteraceae bacterium]|nr:radical SAM protein [Desulfobacteraceae bacterium]
MGKRHTSNGFKTDEQGAVIKRGKGLIKTALVYPNTYKAGMSSLGYQTLYKLLNDLENVACQRVFLPEKGSRKTVGVSSIETGLALNKFDIILFSISFENDFLHLVQLLVGTGIPLRSSDRNHIHPLVIAGGVACFLNPEPIAPFMDCFLLGEAEMLIKPFFALYEEDPSREKLLNIIEEKVGGAYVPFMHRPVFIDSAPGPALKNTVKIQYLQNLEKIHTTTQILTSHTAFKNTFLIETLKGCPHGCRFCSAGFIYRPPRIYPVQNILSAIDKAKDLSKKIGFVSSAIADHPDISKICQYGQKNGLKISFSSLRADALTDDLIQALKTAKVKTATIAPEAGTMRMRNIINKKITKAQILSATQRLVSNGIINLRLYFMIGLPFEKEDDVQGIVALTKEIKATFLAAAKKQKKIGT